MQNPPKSVICYRGEQPGDEAAIARVVAAAFGRQDEARLVDELRAGGYVRLSWVAESQGQIVAHVLFSELTIVSPTGSRCTLGLAPVAVAPRVQRQGIGTGLITRGLAACRAAGYPSVFVLGDPRYYRRFGFSAELAAPFDSPYAGEHFMARELVAGALQVPTSRVIYPPPFALT